MSVISSDVAFDLADVIRRVEGMEHVPPIVRWTTSHAADGASWLTARMPDEPTPISVKRFGRIAGELLALSRGRAVSLRVDGPDLALEFRTREGVWVSLLVSGGPEGRCPA